MNKIATILLLFLSFGSSAQINIYDGFDNNENEWATEEGSSGYARVEKGYYEVFGSNEGYWYYAQKSGWKSEQGFRLEGSVTIMPNTISGMKAGLVWGNEGDSAYFVFTVSGEGKCQASFFRSGREEILLPVKNNPFINKTGSNNLRVESDPVAGYYRFYVNEQLMGTAKHRMPNTSYAGFYGDLPGKYRFDNFWMVQDNTPGSFRPVKLETNPSCTGSMFFFHPAHMFGFCIPSGWRVDINGEMSTIWKLGYSTDGRGLVAHYSIFDRDSFFSVSDDDFRSILVDEKGIEQVNYSETVTMSTVKNSEARHYRATYKRTDDGASYTVDRYVVYNRSSRQYFIFQCTNPTADQEMIGQYHATAQMILSSIKWPVILDR